MGIKGLSMLGVQVGDEHIQASVGRMQAVVELARTIRERHTKPLKQPLRSLVVVHSDASFLADLDGELKHYVLEEVRRYHPWHHPDRGIYNCCVLSVPDPKPACHICWLKCTRHCPAELFEIFRHAWR
jgi:hypothetical protein